jgi:hypothetical protein
MIDFVNIDKNLPGGENMGGLAQNCIFGYWNDVQAWPTAPAAPANIEADGVLTGDVIMKAGKRAFTFYSTDDTSELKMNPVGEVDGKSFEMVLTIFNPGLKKKILGFMNAAKNENLFFIVQDSDGQYYLLGDSLRAAKYDSGEVGTGKATSDRKGVTLTFKFKTNNLRVYEGDVTSLVGGGSSS